MSSRPPLLNDSHPQHQEENFDEDMGLYDELRLEEEEEKFGLANDDNDGSDDSDAQSEGKPFNIFFSEPI